jgi:acyl carrier protein
MLALRRPLRGPTSAKAGLLTKSEPHLLYFTIVEFTENFMSSVQETIFGIISKEAGIDLARITPDSTLKELEIQSLDAVQIIFEIEDHYKITLPDRDPNFDTDSVRGLVEAVDKLLADKQAAAPSATQA